ncbi:semaphorin-like protein [Variola virus]|nr:semaphorin-like protein [Variola virus]ABF29344.1 semaphorin-like protein [Variola virus]ABG43320.1 semaphorin-like protein [Variola virus]ABG44739.1 semaphorin-like protein [Variola virus]ABG45144.1 semaphorin-like protein [Variola virus]
MNTIKQSFSTSNWEDIQSNYCLQLLVYVYQLEKVVPHNTFDVIEQYNVLDNIIKPLSNQPIFKGPSDVKWFDIKEKENEHRKYRIYFIKENTIYSFNTKSKQTRSSQVDAQLFSVMVTSKPLFIADIGIEVGMPRIKKYLKCNLNRVRHMTMNKPKTNYAGYACCVICGLIVGIIFTATLLKAVERKLIHTPLIDKTIKDAYIREDCPTD